MPLLAMLASIPAHADDETFTEARLEGYKDVVKLAEPGSIGMIIFVSILLMVVGSGVMLMNSNRSHLD